MPFGHAQTMAERSAILNRHTRWQANRGVGNAYGRNPLTPVQWRPKEVAHVSEAALVQEDPMLPPKQTAPAMRNVGIYIAEDTLARAHAIADEEGVSSRNRILGSFLSFTVDLFPLLKPIRSQIEAFAKRETERLERVKPVTYAEAIALLVEKGLRAAKK